MNTTIIKSIRGVAFWDDMSFSDDTRQDTLGVAAKTSTSPLIVMSLKVWTGSVGDTQLSIQTLGLEQDRTDRFVPVKSN